MHQPNQVFTQPCRNPIFALVPSPPRPGNALPQHLGHPAQVGFSLAQEILRSWCLNDPNITTQNLRVGWKLGIRILEGTKKTHPLGHRTTSASAIDTQTASDSRWNSTGCPSVEYYGFPS